jgi:hypothetical protein
MITIFGIVYGRPDEPSTDEEVIKSDKPKPDTK